MDSFLGQSGEDFNNGGGRASAEEGGVSRHSRGSSMECRKNSEFQNSRTAFELARRHCLALRFVIEYHSKFIRIG